MKVRDSERLPHCGKGMAHNALGHEPGAFVYQVRAMPWNPTRTIPLRDGLYDGCAYLPHDPDYVPERILLTGLSRDPRVNSGALFTPRPLRGLQEYALVKPYDRAPYYQFERSRYPHEEQRFVEPEQHIVLGGE